MFPQLRKSISIAFSPPTAHLLPFHFEVARRTG
jgi:hypothetical protein